MVSGDMYLKMHMQYAPLIKKKMQVFSLDHRYLYIEEEVVHDVFFTRYCLLYSY